MVTQGAECHWLSAAKSIDASMGLGTSSNTGFYANALGSFFLGGGDSKYWSAGDGAWGLCPQRGPGAKPLVRGSWGRSPLQKLAAFCGVSS